MPPYQLQINCNNGNLLGNLRHIKNIKTNASVLKSHCLHESDKIGTFIYWLTQIFFIFWYNVAFVGKNHFPIKNSFWSPVPEIWLQKITDKFETIIIFWISGDNILWSPADHMCLLWFLCSWWGSVMEK